jgi:hypothetical protein
MHELAYTFSRLGQLNESAEVYTQVLNAQKRVLGDDHPRTLNTIRSLASTYWEQGKKAEHASLMAQVHVLESEARI